MASERFNISIIGLGLMGGSLAYGLRGFKDCEIVGYDTDLEVMKKAVEAGAIDRYENSVQKAVKNADLSIFCTYPGAIIRDIKNNALNFKEGSIVSDICGVKEEIISSVTPLLPAGVDYIGIHPMAGKEVDGFSNAEAKIFKMAGFILIHENNCNEKSVLLMKKLIEYLGSDRICLNTAKEHDGIIAYTSDLMHISAASLCLTYPTNMTMIHTAGAFRDCTRIANINPKLWTELLSMNKENIIPYLDSLINNLADFKKALSDDDYSFMHDYLERACKNKREMMQL